MADLVVGVNDLATTHPELVKEWNYKKNGNLKPTDVTAGSSEKVWWLYPYDDPKTGKHFDFEWKSKVYDRTGGNGCPFLSGKLIMIGFNDLLTTHPDIVKEWHPTKNGKLKPTDVTAGCSKKVWWFLPYDDLKTGKHFDFEWESKISNRTYNKRNCPYLCNNAILIGFNDLLTTHPQLAREWHPTKNGNLKPTDVTAGSGKKVWWLLPYDDPKTGKHFDFEWIADIKHRTNGRGCPYLVGKSILIGFNDLATTHPEISAQWHPTKNGKLKPTNVTAGCSKKVWWFLPYDDPRTGKHFDFEWQAIISNRTQFDRGCPYLDWTALCRGFNDLKTINPQLAKEWHPTKNGNLKPTDVTAGSSKKVWWFLPYDDPRTGKHFDFEWQATIISRARKNGNGCPYFKSSKMERLTYDIIKKMGLKFKAEKRFSKCKDIHTLPFDIYLIEKNKIIELDGLQHFRSIDNWGGEEKLSVIKKHDRIKNDFCLKNNIQLLRVPYIYDADNDKDEIVNIIENFINYGIIPDKIVKFYESEQRASYITLLKKI